MRTMLLFGCGMIAVLLLLPSGAEGQKKEKRSTATPATAQDYQALRNHSEITGRIVFADDSSIAFRIDVPQVEKAGNNNNNNNNNRRKKPYGNQNVKLVMTGKDFELDMDAKAQVRKMFVATEYDDKGFLKENAEEKQKLRAKGYLPAKQEDIKSGMVAKLYLTAPRSAGAEGKAARPTVRRIDLIAAGTGSLQPEAVPMKKKNK